MDRENVKQLNRKGGSNTFKFQSFNDRIQHINVNVIHKISESESTDSFFMDALEKWAELNCTTEYRDFQTEIRAHTRSLVEILYHKDKIVQCAIDHMDIPNCTSPILHLITALVKDLQEEFYPLFQKTATKMASLVSSKTPPEILENFSYLFKYLSKELLKDLNNTFDLLIPLLEHEKLYVRVFASESFGFLLRKVRDPVSQTKIYSHLINTMVEQVNNQFYSRSGSIILNILAVSFDILEAHPQNSNNIIFTSLANIPIMLNKLFVLIGNYGQKETMSELWNALYGFSDTLIGDINSRQDSTHLIKNLTYLVQLFDVWTGVRSGNRIGDHSLLTLKLESIFIVAFGSHQKELQISCAKVLSSYALSSTLDHLLKARNLLDIMLKNENVAVTLMFYDMLRKKSFEHFGRLTLPDLLTYAEHNWDLDPERFIVFFAEMFRDDNFPMQLLTLSHSLKSSNSLIRSAKGNGIPMKIINYISKMEWTGDNYDVEEQQLGMLNAAVSALSYFDFSFDIYFATIVSLMSNLSALFSDPQVGQFYLTKYIEGNRHDLIKGLVGKLLGELSSLAIKMKQQDSMTSVWSVVIDDLLPVCFANVGFLTGLTDYLTAIKCCREGENYLSSKNLVDIFAVLKSNIGSYSSSIRLHTFSVLCLFKQLDLVSHEDSTLTGPCKLFNHCLDLERLPNSFAAEREKSICLRRIDALVSSKTLPSLYETVPTRYFLALLGVNFAPLWPEVTKSLVACSTKYNSSFWIIFEEVLRTLTQSNIQQTSSINLFDDETTEEPKRQKNHRLINVSFECTYLNDLSKNWNGTVDLFTDITKTNLKILLPAVAAEPMTLDINNCYVLMIKSLAQMPQIIHDHSSAIVPLFLALFDNEFQTQMNSTIDLTNITLEAALDNDEDVTLANTKHSRVKILAYLSTFSKIRKPRKLYKSNLLYATFNHLLTHGDAKFQQAALECILTWQETGITKYSEILQGLADDDRLRDSIATIDMDRIRTTLNEEDQKPFINSLCRILYGKLISRRGRNSAKSGVKARRVAIFGFLATLTDEERSMIIDLMLDPFKSLFALKNEILPNENEFSLVEEVDLYSLCPIKKQIGFLSVVEDFINQLRTLVSPFLPKLMETFLYMIHGAERVIESETKAEDYIVTQARLIRTLTMKRFTLLYSIDVDFNFTPYISQHFKSFINARVQNLETENTQAASAFLELLSSWSKDRRYVRYLFEYNPDLVSGILRLLSAKKVHETVVTFVLSIIENIQYHQITAVDDAGVSDLSSMFNNYVPLLLEQCESLLEKSFESVAKGKNIRLIGESIPTRVIRILSQASSSVTSSTVAEKLINILVPFLKSSVKAVPETTKTEILRILRNFIPLIPSIQTIHPSETVYYPILSQLFDLLVSRDARLELLACFRSLTAKAPELEKVCQFLSDLNAYSTKRIDEPDFNTRFTAYSEMNQTAYLSFSIPEWKPILYNFFHFVRDPEEFSIRTSASFGIVRFIERAQVEIQESLSEEYRSIIVHQVFPQIKKGCKISESVIRHEYVLLLGKLVELHGTMPEFEDMVHLRGMENDDETNFFSNITHLQVHRRVKALRLLSKVCDEGKLQPTNVSNVFISILAHFIFESNKVNDHNIINEAISTIGSCCGVLKWGQYYSCIKRFMNSFSFRPELEKVLIRLIIHILDRFHFVLTLNPAVVSEAKEAEIDLAVIEPTPDADNDEETNNDTEDIDEETFEDNEKEQDEMDIDSFNQTEADKIHLAVTEKLIPSIQRLISVKNDESVPIRTPLAIALTRLLQLLPRDSLHAHLPKLVSTLCNILSSHLQSSRDSSRSTLVKISSMLGPKYLGYIVKGLTTALKRGYQLHVLGYTVHAIISENVGIFPPESVDNCVGQIVAISIQDIFGETGKEREVQELKGKMREIKTTKSFETIECLCKIMGFHKLNELLLPLKELMLETNQIKVIRQIEEVFNRTAVGLNANPSIKMVDFMVFIQQLLSESLPLTQHDAKNVNPSISETEKHIRVQLKRSDANFVLKYYEMNVHMFVEFGLSLLLTSLKRDKIQLNNVEHLQMLDPLVDFIGKSMYSKHASINILSIRIFTNIIKAKLPALNNTLPVVVKRLFQIVSKSSSTDTELVQNVFKLLTVILRDCKHVEVPEKKLVAILALLGPDIEEPEKQTTTFSLIRAILGKKMVVSEIYDLMDRIARVLVTSQSSQVRELCRQAFIQFLVDYPHGHLRLRKLIAYLVSNLEYEFESGRISVLELFNLGVAKFSEEVFQSNSDMIFLSVVMVLANDESSKCKEIAGLLIISICKRLDVGKMDKPLLLLKKWFDQEQKELKQVACQLVGLVIDAFGDRAKKWIDDWKLSLTGSLTITLNEWKNLQNDNTNIDEELEYWELGYMSLKSVTKMLRAFPSITTNSPDLWSVVTQLLLHPHQWIRLLASQLIGSIFSFIDPSTRKLVASAVGKSNTQESYFLLKTEGDIRSLAKQCCDQLDSDYITTIHAKQVTKNLVFLSKCLIPFLSQDKPDIDELNEDDAVETVVKKGESLLWLMKRLCFLSRSESAKKNRGITLRANVFQYFAAIFKHIPKSYEKVSLQMMITCLYHTEKDETLKGEDISNF
ncbi:U3 snoRNP protein [Globomyces sp. JEL0801]|nr:U3 snoRNP protein [Globomyces sp. JEL0801]